MESGKHVWQFSQIGGVNRVNLESGEDLLSLDQLDQKLWTALSCPVNGLEIDAQTLSLIDVDHDGKIRVPEILDAVKWITSIIKDPGFLIAPAERMPLSAINVESAEGLSLFNSAKQILANIGKAENDSLSVEETSDKVAIFAETKFNGDGIITDGVTDDENLKALIAQIIQCEGATTDRSGKDGISLEQIETFYLHAEEYANWIAKSETDAEIILPFGENTEAAYQAFQTLKSKIDDYFLRCQLAEFDPVSVDTLNAIYARLETINSKEFSTCLDEIAGFPLAKIEANKPLSFETGINPAWKEQLLNARSLFFKVEEQKTTLTEQEWKALSAKFEAYQQWLTEKAGTQVEQLGIDTVRLLLNENRKEELLALIEEDKKLEEEANNIIKVEKMVRLYRDIFTLLKNFVTFSDFYTPGKQAIFQAGSLYYDQRNCDLCIKVTDMAKHQKMAAASGICLVYFDCFSKVKEEKMTIVAAFTDGDVDNLEVGRNAIFYDKNGLDWDATVVKIIDNPISIRQAFWSPYRKFSRFISKQVEKIASSKDNEIQGSATSQLEKTTTNLAQKPVENVSAKPAPFDIAKFAGIFAAIGLAFGYIGSTLSSIVGGFLALTWWKMPLALLGIILLISGPSMFLAWLKLRKRNLAPVLDANGWAINARATINIGFGASLTHLAKLPRNAKLNYIDPFKRKTSPWWAISAIVLGLAALVVLFWKLGLLEKWNVY
jgi:hypothetical protein